MFLRMFLFHLFFRMSSHCWLCPGTFGNRRELRLHVASAPQFRLRVVCPWCVGIERTSNRMADFKKHVNVKHSGVGVSNDFFSEASGFYLALYPTDYARVINPIPMTSPGGSSGHPNLSSASYSSLTVQSDTSTDDCKRYDTEERAGKRRPDRHRCGPWWFSICRSTEQQRQAVDYHGAAPAADTIHPAKASGEVGRCQGNQF